MEVLLAATDRAEQLFDSLGLMSGPLSPLLRGAVSFGLTSLAVWAFRPELWFYEDGSPRPWAYTDPQKGSAVIPWWSLPLLVAFFIGNFV